MISTLFSNKSNFDESHRTSGQDLLIIQAQFGLSSGNNFQTRSIGGFQTFFQTREEFDESHRTSEHDLSIVQIRFVS